MTPKTALQLVDDHAGNKRTSVMRTMPADGITATRLPRTETSACPFQRAASDSLHHFTVRLGPGQRPDYQSPKAFYRLLQRSDIHRHSDIAARADNGSSFS